MKTSVNFQSGIRFNRVSNNRVQIYKNTTVSASDQPLTKGPEDSGYENEYELKCYKTLGRVLKFVVR